MPWFCFFGDRHDKDVKRLPVNILELFNADLCIEPGSRGKLKKFA